MKYDKEFVIIKEDESLNENFDAKQSLVRKVYESYLKGVNEYLTHDLITCLEKCESPIEQLLRLELERLNLTLTFKYNPYIDIIDIYNQKEIVCGENKYRVDFLIPVVYKNQENKCFIIECDGHEFHQKTKEQVKKDNIRTRNLQKAGYEIIRFSGSEIWNNTYKCALEIKKIIFSRCKYISDKEK